MIHLMKLELMKEKFTGTLIALVSIMLFCLGFVVLICYSTLAEDGTFPFTTVQELFLIGDVLYRVCFIVFAGVLIARVVVGEFDTGNARNLFTYPISRKKLLGCKLLLVSLITFVGYTVSNLVYIVSVTLINNWKNMVPQHISLQMAAEAVPGILLEGVLLCGISLLALPFGMRKKSVSQTIVAASIISMVLNGGFGDNVNGRLYSIAAVPVLLCLVGIVAAVYTCRRVCRTDV